MINEILTKRGWLINNKLTCIPNTKTFWHDLLEWIPNLEPKMLDNFQILSQYIESQQNIPEYIIRNGTFFRKINLSNVKTISLIQDIYENNYLRDMQNDVIKSSDVIVFNSEYTKSYYDINDKINYRIIPLGVDFEKFVPMNNKDELRKELGIEENSILFIGSTSINPKGFDKVLKIFNATKNNFVFVLKDNNYKINNKRIKIFEKVDHDKLVKIINCCELLICTSNIETQHLAGIEAAACNIPVIATNVGIYYNNNDNRWGLISNSLDEFIFNINYILNNKNKFSPRQCFLDEGLDKNTCKKRWIDLISNLSYE